MRDLRPLATFDIAPLPDHRRKHDHDHQIALLEQYGDEAYRIKRAITGEKVSTCSSTFQFIGIDAYFAAGGTITTDLFSRDGEGYADKADH